MCRRPRLHLPGGFYYLCAERSEHEPPFFVHNEDILKFEELLADTLRRCDIRAHAFCWERRAIRLIVEVNETPTSKLIERLMPLYLRYFAQAHPGPHQLPNSRHRAILFDPDAYLLPLVRYLHWRPAIAAPALPVEWSMGAAGSHGSSSHRVYLGRAHKPWLTLRTVLWSLCGAIEMHPEYRRFMGERPTEEEIDRLESGSAIDSRVLGEQNFLCQLPPEWPVHCSLATVEDVMASVALHFGIDVADIGPEADDDDAVLIRAVVAWQATRRRIVSFAELKPWLGRSPSTLVESINYYRSLYPHLFTIAIKDAGPLLPLRVAHALVAQKPKRVCEPTTTSRAVTRDTLLCLAS